jgi:hypothetical protein
MMVSVKRGSRASVLNLACLLSLALGCAASGSASSWGAPPWGAHREGASDSKAALEGIGSILVIGFRPVIFSGRQPHMVRHPLTGESRSADPVPEGVADKLTSGLFDRLTRTGGFQFLSPRDARSQISASDSASRVSGDLDLYLRIGESLSADAFLAGYVWKWKDRKGAEFAVESAASVDVDLYLVSLRGKGVVWKFEYDKTQQSLAENLLDLNTFLRAKGRWLSAFELAELGLERMVESFPKKIGKD